MTHFDLVIVGTGSGNSIPGPELEHLSIAIVEDGLFGGTCLNVGCIPTKMFVHPAELADASRHGRPLGVNSHLDSVDWVGIRDRIFARIDAIEAGGRAYREGPDCANITVFAGHGHFSGHKTLTIDLHDGGTETITGDRFVLAAGSRAVVPQLPGLDAGEVPFHTSDTIMRLDALPASIAILGGGFIAAEFAHVFSSFGVAVTQIARGSQLLRQADGEISAQFTRAASARYEVLLETTVTRVLAADPTVPGAVGAGASDAVVLDLATPTGPRTLHADLLLVATGRTPNSDGLNYAATGLAVEDDGRITVDEFQRTTVPGIFALGDLSSADQLKHVANHEARVVKHNLLHPEELQAADHRYVPSAVFADPQIATVGLTEEQARDAGVPYVVKVQAYGDIAAGWAREDTGNFLKVLADPVTGLLVGAHVIGPEAATVIQPLIQAMSFGQSAHVVAQGQYWIHPALSELVENALLGLPAPTGR